jgi:hypothetical protein
MQEEKYLSMVDDINMEFIDYRKTELEKEILMESFKRITNKCFNPCIEKLKESNLTPKEKECLSICYNNVLKIRDLSLQMFFED